MGFRSVPVASTCKWLHRPESMFWSMSPQRLNKREDSAAQCFAEASADEEVDTMHVVCGLSVTPDIDNATAEVITHLPSPTTEGLVLLARIAHVTCCKVQQEPLLYGTSKCLHCMCHALVPWLSCLSCFWAIQSRS
eukprot:2844042-Amphidinium_carterae.1